MSGQETYLETEIMTASPYRLHLLTIDGALRFARRAIEALGHNDLEAAHSALNRSRALVGELIAGLDESRAPEMIGQLKAVFVFAYHNLALADSERDAGRIQSALRVLNLHRETWIALHERLLQEQPAAAASSLESEASLEAPPHRSWVG